MAYQLLSAALGGIDARAVQVQIDSSPGLHTFTIVGLGDKAVQESIDRIEAAVKQSGFSAPRSKNRHFVVNLAPADLKKEGPGYDLPIAVAYLVETRQCNPKSTDCALLGELGLDGRLAHTNGVLAATLMARDQGIREIIVPSCNVREATLVSDIAVIGADTLSQVLSHLDETARITATSPEIGDIHAHSSDDSFAFIQGQNSAKRSLIVSAAGAHNMLMSGSPGAGKTLLARSIVGLLPPMTSNETIDVAKIYSAAGLLRGSARNLPRPFCAPHHTSSAVAMVGGGTVVRPGQISLAHRGVLFLDEMPEFARNVLEALRQPLEDGIVTVSRASGTLILPAKFMLVGAMNPCPCGHAGDAEETCICTATAITKYTKKISGPLLDRMDMQVLVSRERVNDNPTRKMEDLQNIRDSIASARQRQISRLSPFGMVTNSEISHKNIEDVCSLSSAARALLQNVVNHKHLSLRAYHKIMKIARTIADLEDTAQIAEQHIAEASAMRISDRMTP